MPEDNSLPITESTTPVEPIPQPVTSDLTQPTEIPVIPETPIAPIPDTPTPNPLPIEPAIVPETPQPIENPAIAEAKAKELVGATKGRNWLPIILVIVVLLLLGGGVVAGLTIFKDQIPFLAVKPTPTPEPIIVPTPTPTPIPDPTADWKSYSNTKYNYSIKYPLNWVAKEEKNTTTISNVENYDPLKPSTVDFRFDIDVAEKLVAEPKLDQKVMVKIGGLDGVKGILTGGEGEKIIFATIVKESKTFNFYGRQADSALKDNFDQILSTFKFLDASQSTENWKTYTNSKYRYSIKYPQEWFLEDLNGLVEIRNVKQVDITSYDNPKNMILDIQILDEKDYDSKSAIYDAQKTNTTVDGQNATKGNVTYESGNGVFLISFIKDSKYYGFSLRPSNSELKGYFEQIVSTFKFLN